MVFTYSEINNESIFSLFGLKITPFSVIIPVTKSAGVTSKAGLRTETPVAAHRFCIKCTELQEFHKEYHL